jgi:hypothetical protein
MIGAQALGRRRRVFVDCVDDIIVIANRRTTWCDVLMVFVGGGIAEAGGMGEG